MKPIRTITSLLLAVCMLLSFASCGAKNDSMHARFSKLYEADTLGDYLKDPQTYADQIDGYMLDDFAATFKETDKYRIYSVEIRLNNTNDYAIEMLNLQMDTAKQGKNGVWFSLYADGSTIGLPANFTDNECVYYQAIADASLSKQEVLEALGKMHIECVFVDAAVDTDDMEHLDPAALHVSSVLYEK